MANYESGSYSKRPRNMQPISVCIVEDDHDIRASLSLIIDGADGFECVNNHYDAESALTHLMQDLPDVILMDIELPGMSGIDCVRQVKQQLPECDILMLTVHEHDKVVFESLCAGACGYLTKNTKPRHILNAIREVQSGGAPMSTNIARMVVGSFKTRHSVGLSDREREVLSQLCTGKSYKMIADALFISSDTVRSHIKSIYKKLEVSSNAEAVARALKEKLV